MKNKVMEDDVLLKQQNSVVVENFHKKFKDVDIGPFSFNIEKGKVTALLGSSGSGKSVFLNSLLGATLNYNGRIYINSKDRKKANSIANNSEVGFYSQMDFSLYSISAFDFLKNMCNVMGIDKHQANSRIEYWLKKFDLWSAKDKALNAFSWGMKNRMNLILCFIKEPQILILDEPGANLDSKWRNHTYDILNQFKQDSECTIILTVHNIDEIYDIIENFVILEKGKLLFSGTKEDLNLYKKIKVSFEKNIDLALIEQILNEHDILTFDFNQKHNSIIVGLKPGQNFNDVLATFEAYEIKTKDIIGQPINIDEIQKALKDKLEPHQPKYAVVNHQTPVKANLGADLVNLSVNEPIIANDAVNLQIDSVNNQELKILAKADNLVSNVTEKSLDSEKNVDAGDEEIKQALSFLEKIERKYDNKIDFDHNVPTLITNPEFISEIKDQVTTETFKIEQAEMSKEIKAISLRLANEKEGIDEIKNEIKLKVEELKALQAEVAVATYAESQNLLSLKSDFADKLADLRKYVEQLKTEDQLIEVTKQQLNLQIQELLNLKADITNLINDEKDLIQGDIKELKLYISQVHFETEIMADAKQNLEKKADELKEFLAKTDFENQSLEAKQQELQTKFDEIKNLQTEVAFNSFAEHQSLEDIKQVFEGKIFELKELIGEVHQQEQNVDIAKTDLTMSLNDLKELKIEIETAIREERDSLNFEITDLKIQLDQIKHDSDDLQQSKEFLAKQTETLKKTQTDFFAMLKTQEQEAQSKDASLAEVNKHSNDLKAELEAEKMLVQTKIDDFKKEINDAKLDSEGLYETQQFLTEQAVAFKKMQTDFYEKINEEQDNAQFNQNAEKASLEQLSNFNAVLKAELNEEKLAAQTKIDELKQYLANAEIEAKKLHAISQTNNSQIDKQSFDQHSNINANQKQDIFWKKAEEPKMIYTSNPSYPEQRENQECTSTNRHNQIKDSQTLEIENLKENLYKEYAYFEKMRHEAKVEKEMNDKLSTFDKELKMREEKLELERLKREIQEEKNKLSEFILLQKIGK